MFILTIKSEYDEDDVNISTHESPAALKEYIEDYVADEVNNFDSVEEFWDSHGNRFLSAFMKDWEGKTDEKFDAYPYSFDVRKK